MSKILVVVLLMALPMVMNADRLIRIPMQTDSDFTLVRDMGYDIAAGSRADGYVDVMVGHRFVEETMNRYPGAKLLPLEWSELSPATDASEMGYYYGPNENALFWAELAESNDMVDTPTSFGTSFQGRDLNFVRITNAGPNAPAILFTALTHAREPGGNSVVIDWAQWLTTEYGNDTMATFILDNAQIYIVPIVNPDGYVYNNPHSGSGDGHRKNMNFTTPVASSGIDLNRNYSYQWGYDNSGSSPDPYSETYRGESELSEPETLAETQWIDSIEPVGGFHYHTYGGYLLFPYGYNNQPTPHQATFESWGNQMAAQNGYQVGRCGQVLYIVNGDAVDWSYGASTHSPMLFYTPEVDDNGFWGSQNDSTLIVTNNLECRYMNKLLCMNLLNMTGVQDGSFTEFQGTAMSIVLESNPVTSVLSYAVTGAVSASVSVLDVTGRVVATPSSEDWTVPASLQNGIYFLRAENGNQVVSQRFTVLR